MNDLRYVGEKLRQMPPQFRYPLLSQDGERFQPAHSPVASARPGALACRGKVFLQLLDQDLPYLRVAETGEQLIDGFPGFGLQCFNRRRLRAAFSLATAPVATPDSIRQAMKIRLLTAAIIDDNSDIFLPLITSPA